MSQRLGKSPVGDGKLACCNCHGRYAAHLMVGVLRPSERWNKRQWYCQRCNKRRWINREKAQ